MSNIILMDEPHQHSSENETVSGEPNPPLPPNKNNESGAAAIDSQVDLPPPLNLRIYIVVYAVAALVVIALVYLVFRLAQGHAYTISADEAVKLGAALLVLLSAIMTVAVAIGTLNAQVKSARLLHDAQKAQNLTLEGIRDSNTVKLEDIRRTNTENLEELRNTNTTNLENIKNSNARELQSIGSILDRDIEYLKTQLSGKIKAFEELNKAASIYYYTVARIESGRHDADKTLAAEAEMIKSTAFLFHLSKKDEALWHEFWQAGNFLSEAVLTEKYKTPEAQKLLWQTDSGREFAEAYVKFRQAWQTEWNAQTIALTAEKMTHGRS